MTTNLPPGRELDALVAEKVIELENVQQGCSCGYIKPPNYSWGDCSAVKPYSTDISAAFEVVEKMKSLGFKFVCGDTVICADHGDVGIRDAIWACFGLEFEKAKFIPGSTFAHSICLAAIKAVGAGDE